jgi:hypothetical protein
VRRPFVLGLIWALLTGSSGLGLRAEPLAAAPEAQAPSAPSAPGGSNPDLRSGIAAVEAGDYAEGVASLSRALRQLGADPVRRPEQVRAYLHLGVAFAGLGQESPALSQFAQALLRQPDATLDVKGAPERARRLFEEARRDAAPAIAAAEERKKKASKTPLVLAGLAVIGTGVGVATVAGGEAPSTERPPLPPAEPGPVFRFGSAAGNPFLSFLGGEPASGTTLKVGTAHPRFRYQAQISGVGTPIGPFARLQATVELGTVGLGICWRAESALFALAPGEIAEIVVDSFPVTPSCPAPFSTLTVDAKLFDRDSQHQLANTIYSGGYKVVP